MLKIKRPTILTVTCILAILRFLVLFAMIASPDIKRLGGMYPAIFGVITAAQFISIVGIWHMKKWGVHWFTTCFFVKLFVLVTIDDLGGWTIVGGVSSALYLVAFMSFYKDMDENL